MPDFRFQYRLTGNLGRKSQIYFTCHPEDFDSCFKKICEDILNAYDCVIAYAQNMTDSLADENRDTDFERINLFVVPVTRKLLTTPNRAMDEDIPYALEKHIPVLPLVMESGVDAFYGQKFGQLQYLNTCSTDSTEIAYSEKLKKHLESVLLSNELVNRIQNAFDAYIFLSYRKKDRRYANELMHLIHSNQEYRDIAIWFDEFLTPGENFKENIDKILHRSQLFALLVTPNVLEKTDGKPNFVMGEEYPAAKRAGLEILPAEMEATDRNALKEAFIALPELVNARDEVFFRKRLLTAAAKLAIPSNNTPEHNYLIGLAYLEGIDVEVNRPRGIALITEAAELGFLEAMERLHLIYSTGAGAPIDYQKALHWAKAIAQHYENTCDSTDEKLRNALHTLGNAYASAGEFLLALETAQRIYRLECEIYGEDSPAIMTSLNNLAMALLRMGHYRKALELQEKAYALSCKENGESHPVTLTYMGNLASAYSKLENHKKAVELSEQVYQIRTVILGEDSPETLVALHNLATAYNDSGNHEKARELHEKAYRMRSARLGEEHPDTVHSLHCLSAAYRDLGDHQTALELQEHVYAIRCRVLGETHPNTLTTLSLLATSCRELEEYEKELGLREKSYALHCAVLGEEHPDTLTALHNLALVYDNLGDSDHSIKLGSKAYNQRRKVLGEKHPRTLASLRNVCFYYKIARRYKTALLCFNNLYLVQREVYGPEHPNTLETWKQIQKLQAILEENP